MIRRERRPGDAIRSAITRLGVGRFAELFADDAEVVQRVSEVVMPGTELGLLQYGGLTQMPLR
jgi:hypothetical protein